MTELYQILIAHAAKYPALRPRDAYKLAYQHTMGGGHMIADANESLSRLSSELEATPARDVEPFTVIGNSFARMELANSDVRALGAELLNRIFVASSSIRPPEGSMGESCRVLVRAARDGVLPFDAGEMEGFIRARESEGFPAVSHSNEYREACAPAYRVVDAGFARLLPALSIIRDLKRPSAIAIDGMCASGKTTLAELLARVFDAAVVHMDDFFLPKELRTPARYKEPGGNVHYERFKEEVLPHLGCGVAFKHGVFDCSRMEITAERELPARPLTIVEGTYSTHPAFGAPYALTLMSTISKEEQESRILARDGEEMLQRFREMWIPMEEAYFAALDNAVKLIINNA